MRKIYLFVLALIFPVFVFSCGKEVKLYDILISVTADENSLPAGKIMCYGNIYEDSISESTLTEYLGLYNYPEFKDNIEELCVYSSLKGDYCELALIKLYRVSDVHDAKLFFERRIKLTERTLNLSGKKGYAENAKIKIYGNIVVLYMMPDNSHFENKIKSKI